MHALTKHLSISETSFLLDGEPFDLQGVSFFNALFNEEFCKSDESMLQYLGRFKEYGINMIRVWCQWDFYGANGMFVDIKPGQASLYDRRGNLAETYWHRLSRLLLAADQLGMVVEVCALARERYLIPEGEELPYELIPYHETAIKNLAVALLPYRNVILQIWNECSFEVLRYLNIIKSIDDSRICTNSPGGAGVLGDDIQNTLLDVLTPHTSRAGEANFWEQAANEVGYLLNRFGKPVIDDEPARCGVLDHGGIPGGTQPWQHIEQMNKVRALGAYHLYHHDMFQNGYGHPSIPATGVPDPDKNAFHKEVFKAIMTRSAQNPKTDNGGKNNEKNN